MKALNFIPGMNVVGKDNIELGTIQEVWIETETHGCLPVSRCLMDDYGPVRGTGELFATKEGYLQVRGGDTLGFGGRDLWVPFHAIEGTQTATCASVRMPAGLCETRFIDRPELLAVAA